MSIHDEKIIVPVAVPTALHEALQHYLELNPTRNANDAILMGLCLFLMQNRASEATETNEEARKLASEYLRLLLPKRKSRP